MNAILEQINSAGYAFVEFALPMLVQSSVLIVILLSLDFMLKKKVRAVFRYCIWMLVLVKLVLPSSLSSPVSFGYWLGVELPSIKVTDKSAAVSEVSMSKMAEAAYIEVSSEAPAVTAPMMDVEPAVVEAASQPAVTSVAPVTWQGVVFLVWLAVVGVMGLLLLQRAIFVSGLVAQAKKPSSLMDDALKYCCRCIGIRGKVGLKVSANATSPAVCGLFRPVILVPENLGPSLGAGGLRAVLLHELAHIKRGDLWVNLVQTVLQIIYFYNPMLWLANAMIRRVREQAVDETVQVAMGEKARQYPETLVNVAKLAFKRPALSLRLIGVVESKSALKGRVRHMLNRPIPKSAKLGLVGLLAVIIIGAVLLPMAKAEKQKTEVRSQKTEFAATLANGVTVELIGVCEHPSEGKQWWRPDGDVMDERPYKAEDKYIISDYNDEAYQLVEFAIKISYPGHKDVSTQIVVPTAVRTSVTDAGEDEQNSSMKSIACVVPKLFSELEVFKAGVAYGQWQKLSSIDTKLSQHLTDDTVLGKVIWDIPKQSKGRATISLAHTLSGQNTTVFAEGTDGSLIKAPGSWSSGSTEKYEFYIPLSKIKKFHFMARPYQWVEFKNVSLKPGQITDVQVKGEETGKVSEADKMASENFAGEAWALWRQRKLAEAEEVFKKAVLKDSKNANAWNGLGWSQFQQGKPLNAKISLEKCLKINPRHSGALNGLGWIAKGQGKTDEAIGHWEEAVEAAPGATAALNGLATTYMELEQYDKAVKYYEMWLKVEPDNANAKAGLEKAKAQSQNVNLVSKEAEPADLQSLIDSARVGGTVIVPKGVYTKPIEINKSLTLKGESRTDCIFEVIADRPAIFVDTKGKGRVTIEGVTIKWQLATSDKNIGHRFAVAVKDTKADVKNCSFIPLGNFKRCPTAIQAVGFSRLSINACQFEGFEYTVCYGEGTEGTIQNCIVMDSGHQGISLYSGATAKIIGNVVTGSRYHAVRSTGGTLFMKDNLIIENANRGVYLGNKSARGTISNNIIMGNGTGISGFAQSKVKIENNVIADSSYAGIGMRESCSLLIRNNIFQGNERGWIMFKEGGRGGNTSYRNTFWQNKTDAENFRKTANSISADPGFVDVDNGDFSLKSGPALEHKQGLTNPEVFKTLWKRWQRREDKKP